MTETRTSDLHEHVVETIRRRRLFHRGERLLVAVSGGVDSVVLLHLLHEMTPRLALRLTVAHFNHGLRGSASRADERLVRRTAKALRLPFVTEQANVREFARDHHLSVEMAARALRHEFLARTAHRLRISTVALAHHADDQLELFFLRLFRGAGAEGLAGMAWRNPSPADRGIELVRPLLDQPKAVLAAYARQNKIRFREDATNAMTNIQRNRIRHKLLPLLRRHYQPALDQTVLRLMDILGAEATLTAQLASEWLKNNRRQQRKAGVASIPSPSVTRMPAGTPALPVRAALTHSPCLTNLTAPFESLPIAVQRRCLHQQLLGLGLGPEFDLIEQLRLNRDQPVSVAAPKRPRAISSDSMRLVRESTGLLRPQPIESMAFMLEAAELDLAATKTGHAVFGGAKVAWRIERNGPAKSLTRRAGREFFDADAVGPSVRLRHWQPGDRFQPIGMRSAVKLQDIFTNEKVPQARRHRLVVAERIGAGIFWVEGLRISEQFKVRESTIRRLQWRWWRS
jgi:tRNA(Ile)-lysidine synthase